MDVVKLSKSLSWLLRHGAEKEGLSFDDGGFVDVEKILKLKQFRQYTTENVLKVVECNDKKRFSTRLKEGNILQIRANQGHTLPVAESGLLSLLTEGTVPSTVYHGTYFSKLEAIRNVGLSRMKRNHIHFAPKPPGDDTVISGMRKNCEIFIVIDAVKTMKDGYKFYVSENGVILCPGNECGIIPPTYFKEIWQMRPLKRLDGSA